MAGGRRISGRSFEVRVGDFLVQMKKMTLAINDGGGVATDNGVPNGWTDGVYSASGEIEINTRNFKILNKAAGKAGSWQDLEAFDITSVADCGAEENLTIDAYGCKLRLSDLLAVDEKSSDEHIHKIKFDVTDPNFVAIDGVPVISPKNIENLN